VAVATYGPEPAFSKIWVAPGDGAGGLGSPVYVNAGPNTLCAAMADFDHDTHLDIVATNETEAKVSVVRGFGNGTFQYPPVPYATAVYPRYVVAGDVNGDGHPDIVASNFGSSSVSVLLGNGAAGFAPKIDTPTPVNPYRMAIGDLNGDGRQDVVVECALQVVTLLGTPSGALISKPTGLGAEVEAVALADLDLDGKLDLLAAGLYSLLYLRGKGDGTFAAGVANFLGLDTPYGIAAGDWNGDGHPDVAVADFGRGAIATLYGNSTGVLAGPQMIGVGHGPSGLATGNFNGDGSSDLAVVVGAIEHVQVLLGWPPVAGILDPSPMRTPGLWLRSPYPNPSRRMTTSVSVSLPHADHAVVTVHDAAGRLVRTLVERKLDGGEHTIEWDGRTTAGTRASAGVYFVRLRSGIESVSSRFVRLP
jgi:hypothetical protein